MKNQTLRSRLTVLMVADMVGYTSLMDQNEREAISAVNELRNRYLEPLVQTHKGEVLKRMGDGWIIAFSSVADQVRCAIEVQSGLVDHSVIKLRIGAHIGELYEDKNDFYGAGVNLSHRLQTEAPPGGLMVSQALYQQLPSELQIAFQDMGSFHLKNITQPVNAFQWRPDARPFADSAETITTADEVPSVVVMPFEFAPDEGDIKAVAIDLRDQIIIRLSARTGIRMLDESSHSNNLATYLLQGRLRISGDQGRLNLKFVLPSEGRTVLSKSYQGNTTDIFQFTDELIERVDTDLRLQITAFDGDRIAHLSDDALSISELRSRAASEFCLVTMQSYARGDELMNKALLLNPQDPMALAMRAESQIYAFTARHKQLSKEQIHALETDLNLAVELSPQSDYIFTMRSSFRSHVTRDVKRALADAERALKISPDYSWGQEALGLAYLLDGDFSQAADTFAKVISLADSDPYLPMLLYLLSISFHLDGKHESAIKVIDQAIQIRPTNWSFHLLHAICNQSLGDDAAALESENKSKSYPQTASILALRPPLPDTYQEFADKFAPT
jgi:adenylate cyclase